MAGGGSAGGDRGGDLVLKAINMVTGQYSHGWDLQLTSGKKNTHAILLEYFV